MDHILYQIFKIFLNRSLKTYENYGQSFNNPSIIQFMYININKIGNRTPFKLKTGCYLKLLTPENMKLLRSTKSKITKTENGKNGAHLDITQVILANFNIINIDYQQTSRVL